MKIVHARDLEPGTYIGTVVAWRVDGESAQETVHVKLAQGIVLCDERVDGIVDTYIVDAVCLGDTVEVYIGSEQRRRVVLQCLRDTKLAGGTQIDRTGERSAGPLRAF